MRLPYLESGEGTVERWSIGRCQVRVVTGLLPAYSAEESNASPSRWPRVLAVAFSALLCTFLAIESRHFGTDLRVYRESVSAWSKGVDPYLVSFTNGLHFTYTPFALVLLWPLRLGSFQVTEWVLWAMHHRSVFDLHVAHSQSPRSAKSRSRLVERHCLGLGRAVDTRAGQKWTDLWAG